MFIQVIIIFIHAIIIKKILDKIKHFPPLYLEVKTQNLTFIFTFKELFNEFKNRIYFLIAFRDDTYYM